MQALAVPGTLELHVTQVRQDHHVLLACLVHRALLENPLVQVRQLQDILEVRQEELASEKELVLGVP